VLTGYVEEGDLPLLLGAADALAFPSLHEGFGLPALEAMACGVPVLAANAAALPEVVGDAGVLFDPRDVQAMAGTIAQVLSDKALRAVLSERGLERARLYSWERAARETAAVLREAALA
jgi:glycosyltransferase involved in cell wall biosynthesis